MWTVLNYNTRNFQCLKDKAQVRACLKTIHRAGIDLDLVEVENLSGPGPEAGHKTRADQMELLSGLGFDAMEAANLGGRRYQRCSCQDFTDKLQKEREHAGGSVQVVFRPPYGEQSDDGCELSLFRIYYDGKADKIVIEADG